jgi:release factor glutamine methyltransferase
MKFEDKVAQLRIKKHKGRETDAFLQDVKRMASGEPLEYILGEVTFCGATIDLSMRPMIPRPETEFWVNQVITELRNNERREKGMRILDLFSGSGNVGLALLVSFPKVHVDMIELDQKLKEQIEISVAKNTIEKTRVRVITGDTWDGAEGVYDCVFAVPPYVPPKMRDEVMSELHAEDPLSFFDKEDGYYYHKQVLSRAKEFLKDKGVLYLEFDITQRERIEELARLYGYKNYSFLKDPYGHEYVLIVEG